MAVKIQARPPPRVRIGSEAVLAPLEDLDGYFLEIITVPYGGGTERPQHPGRTGGLLSPSDYQKPSRMMVREVPHMADNWNTGIIEEFRANGGRVGGPFEGAPLLLLHHVGARTGTERVNPLMYRALADGHVIFASKGGAPNHPDWYQNLLAHPDVIIEVGEETEAVRARVANGEEREVIWMAQAETFPQFGEYQEKTSRQIPVIILEPRD